METLLYSTFVSMVASQNSLHLDKDQNISKCSILCINAAQMRFVQTADKCFIAWIHKILNDRCLISSPSLNIGV